MFDLQSINNMFANEAKQKYVKYVSNKFRILRIILKYNLLTELLFKHQEYLIFHNDKSQ